MKTVNCDCCKKLVEERSMSVGKRTYWVKYIARYVGRKTDDTNLDLCNLCYSRIQVFIVLLTKAEGRLDWMFLQNSRGTSLFQQINKNAENLLLK